MTPQQFYDLVKRMRKAQKNYFHTRTQQTLQLSKYLESQIDAEIERVENILHPKPTQQTLF